MGNGNRYRPGKFYEEQVKELLAKLEKRVKNVSSITLDKYLALCEQLGKEPNPEEMPFVYEDFPYHVQMALFLYSFLSDRWDGTSGSYLGKDWSSIEFLINLYDICDPKEVIFFMKHYEAFNISNEATKQKQKEKKSNIVVPPGVKKPPRNINGPKN